MNLFRVCFRKILRTFPACTCSCLDSNSDKRGCTTRSRSFAEMDFDVLKNEILELKKETIIYYAKKAAIPLTVIPLIWICFLRKTGISSNVQRKGPAKELAVVDDDSSGFVYNLRNLVRFSPFKMISSVYRTRSCSLSSRNERC